MAKQLHYTFDAQQNAPTIQAFLLSSDDQARYTDDCIDSDAKQQSSLQNIKDDK